MAASRTRSIAVTSGKGGVGKSCIALNLAIALSRRQQRVLLVDADLGLGSIAILAGLNPEFVVEDVLAGRCEVVEAVAGGPEGIVVLPASVDADATQWERLEPAEDIWAPLEEFEAGFDVVVLDTGAGIGAKVVDFAAAADEVLLLVTPEPTAIADAYAALKILVQRRPPQGLGLLVNMADSAAEAEDLYVKFQEMAERFLGAKIDNRGYIPLDRYVRESVKRQTPFVLANPPLPAAEALVRLSDELLADGEGASPRGGGIFARILEQRNLSIFSDRMQ